MGGPNSINSLNNPVNGSGYNPRRGGEAQAPNLKDFVLTIDDFRQFADGKHNVGGIRGEQIGAHRAWERLESVDIDPSEAASIRLAFAFALENAGVSGARMSSVCKRLGLKADFSFSENDAKVYTALSRAEVRDIIEQSLGGRSGEGNKIVEKKIRKEIEKKQEKQEAMGFYRIAEYLKTEHKWENYLFVFVSLVVMVLFTRPTHSQHRFTMHSSTKSRWRQRVISI